MCVSCLSVILSCLFLVALWPPAKKGVLALLCVMFFSAFLSFSHIVSRIRGGA